MDSKTNHWKVRATLSKGLGLFAKKAFLKGERVYSFPKGRIVAREEIGSLSREEKQHLDQIGENQFEIIEAPGHFINHSCDPNIEERARVGYALRDISVGEELTVDYDTVGSLEESFECCCGATHCRGVIFGKGRIPPSVHSV